jgi:hypothetical protein
MPDEVGFPVRNERQSPAPQRSLRSAAFLLACLVLPGCVVAPIALGAATVVGTTSSIKTSDVKFTPMSFPDDLTSAMRPKNRLVLLSAGGTEVEAGRLLEASGYVVTVDQSQGNVAQQTQSGRATALAAACGRGGTTAATLAVRLVEMKDDAGLSMFIGMRSGTMSIAVDALNCRSQRVSSFTGSQKLSGGMLQAANFDPNKLAGAMGANQLIAFAQQR